MRISNIVELGLHCTSSKLKCHNGNEKHHVYEQVIPPSLPAWGHMVGACVASHNSLNILMCCWAVLAMHRGCCGYGKVLRMLSSTLAARDKVCWRLYCCVAEMAVYITCALELMSWVVLDSWPPPPSKQNPLGSFGACLCGKILSK